MNNQGTFGICPKCQSGTYMHTSSICRCSTCEWESGIKTDEKEEPVSKESGRSTSTKTLCKECGKPSYEDNPDCPAVKRALAKVNGKVGGRKQDDGKPPFELLPKAALEGAARVLGFGRDKYDAWNWAKGRAWSRDLGAALRHVYAFLDGENDDPESGLPHVDHAICCLMFVSHFAHHPELYAEAHDDRMGSDT